MSSGRHLQENAARELVHIIQKLGSRASFRKVWLEATRRGILRWDRTLRRYLDLLAAGGIIQVTERDVGSVLPQQLYTVRRKKPQVSVGLGVLRIRGLNWEVSEDDVNEVETDYRGLVRATILRGNGRTRLLASLEECLAWELKKDLEEKTGGVTFVAAMLATRRVDLAHLLDRADRIGVGKAMRALMRKILDTYARFPVHAEARVFLPTRERFLSIARQYASQGALVLLEESGVGRTGLNVIHGLTEAEIVNVAGKQLGIMG